MLLAGVMFHIGFQLEVTGMTPARRQKGMVTDLVEDAILLQGDLRADIRRAEAADSHQARADATRLEKEAATRLEKGDATRLEKEADTRHHHLHVILPVVATKKSMVDGIHHHLLIDTHTTETRIISTIDILRVTRQDQSDLHH